LYRSSEEVAQGAEFSWSLFLRTLKRTSRSVCFTELTKQKTSHN
jgi:hypothetical protein